MSFRLGRKAAQPTPQPLSATHPLSLELSSLRTALQHYQTAAHQSSIQLQGRSLELSLLKDQDKALRDENEVLKREVEVLRNHESPPVDPPSTQLAELTLAHRRLSSKLDLTETSLASATHELADAKAEIFRLQKEKEADRAALNDLRRIEEDREEEVDWERREKKRAVEEKKLCDLALAQYAELVKTLDPSAEQPTLPTPPSSATLPMADPKVPLPTTANPRESIAYLLEGQRGVQRLFEDFTASLNAKDAELRVLTTTLEETKTALEDEKEMHSTERQRRVNAELERDQSRRDDQSAAKVVERYMAFTQKTSQTLHAHLDALRTRSNTSLATLRAQLVATSHAIDVVQDRERRLRSALEQMSEDLSRETFGRRREVVLRLKCVAQEERWRRRGEAWRDRVRRARQGPEAAVMELELAETLLDEGLKVLPDVDDGNDKPLMQDGTPGEDSLARVLLAEDLVTTLVADLQKESERRLELETQRVEWLAGEAVAGRSAGDDAAVKPNGGTVFDVGEFDMDGDKQVIEIDAADSPVIPDKLEVDLPSPAIPAISPPADQSTAEALAALHTLLEPVRTRYAPYQRSLHDCASSLATLRASIPSPKHPKLLSRRTTTPQPVSATLLDGIHDVLEDARVEVEIAVADDERVMEGYEAMWRVGQSGSRNASFFNEHSKREEVERFVQGQGAKATKLREQLERKVADLEHDLALVKRAMHEEQGMDDVEGSDAVEQPSSVWSSLPLRTILPPTVEPSSSSSSDGPFEQPRRPSALGGAGSGRALFSGLGRSFSSAINNVPRPRRNGPMSRATSVSNESLLPSPSPSEGANHADASTSVSAEADSDVE